MIVIGIDPGVSRVGFGVLDFLRGKFSYLESGLYDIKTSQQTERLVLISKKTKMLIKKYKPEVVGVEKLFFSKNKKTVMAVSEARGVVVEAVASSGADFLEMTPPQIKALVCGYGKATKDGVARVVGSVLDIEVGELIDDETDALAVAIATAMMHTASNLHADRT